MYFPSFFLNTYLRFRRFHSLFTVIRPKLSALNIFLFFLLNILMPIHLQIFQNDIRYHMDLPVYSIFQFFSNLHRQCHRICVFLKDYKNVCLLTSGSMVDLGTFNDILNKNSEDKTITVKKLKTMPCAS